MSFYYSLIKQYLRNCPFFALLTKNLLQGQHDSYKSQTNHAQMPTCQPVLADP
jgi:hypothetical protein